MWRRASPRKKLPAPQPPRVSEGQRDIRKPGRFGSATPNSSGLTPAVGVITPKALGEKRKDKKLKRTAQAKGNTRKR